LSFILIYSGKKALEKALEKSAGRGAGRGVGRGVEGRLIRGVLVKMVL